MCLCVNGGSIRVCTHLHHICSYSCKENALETKYNEACIPELGFHSAYCLQQGSLPREVDLNKNIKQIIL